VTARNRAQKRIAAFLMLALLAAASNACIARTVRETVVDDGSIQVLLRGKKKAGQTVDQGFEHPITIAPVRMAHILSRIDMRRDDDGEAKRVPAIHLDLLFGIAEGMTEALEKADSSQEVVVQAIRRTKRFGVFDRHYLTSLLCYVRDELLYIHISRSDWEIPKQRNTRLPETHVGKYPLDFRLVVEKGMVLADPQAAAVYWRDPIFRKPTRTRITPSGKVVRRTILMESFEDETDYGPRLGDDLTPEQLRALADLEEERRDGSISEGEYDARRKQIMRGEAQAPDPAP
jgi:hypothetical protein